MSDDLRIVLTPAAAWPLAAKSPDSGHWFSRYLLLMIVTGCAASLLTAGRVTLRIALPCALYTALVPALQIGSLAVVLRGALPLRRAASLFAVGNLPWLFVLLAYAALWAWAPAPFLYRWFGWYRLTAFPLVLWGAYVDYCLFRLVLGRTPLIALRDLAVQRFLCWVVGMTIWVGPAGWQIVRSSLGQ
jgi:hypothetical protein